MKELKKEKIFVVNCTFNTLTQNILIYLALDMAIFTAKNVSTLAINHFYTLTQKGFPAKNTATFAAVKTMIKLTLKLIKVCTTPSSRL